MFFNVDFTCSEEEQSPLEKVCNVVEDGPGLHVDPVGGDFVIVDTVEKQREGLEEDEGCHDPVYTEHLFRTGLLEDENPEAAGQEEEDGEHLVERRQGHLSGREVTIRTQGLKFI